MQNTNIIPDEETFIRISESYWKDKDNIFFVIEKCKYDDFEINEIKSQLENYTDPYDDEIRMRLTDTEWEMYSEIDMSELKKQWSQRNAIQQVIDEKVKCMQVSSDITYLVIEWADLGTFEVLGGEYGKDRNTIYHKNTPSNKLILNPCKRDNPIEPINTTYYVLEDSIIQQIKDPESLQIVGHYNFSSVFLKDKNYLYLYFLDDETYYTEKIRKIFQFPEPNNDILQIYNDHSDDCYIKGMDIIYNYYQEDGYDKFSIVEWVDYKTFNGNKDKLNTYQYWKIYIPSEEEISIDDIPF